MKPAKRFRVAFTAQKWDDSAVVCRAIENRPGTVVDPEFGCFDTWTEANALADRLNQRLHISFLEAREIVANSLLLRDFLIHSACKSLPFSAHSYTLHHSQGVHLRFLHARLQLALTFCQSAILRPSANPRILRHARTVLRDARLFILRFTGDPRELEPLVAPVNSLAAILDQYFPVAEPPVRKVRFEVLRGGPSDA